MSLAQWFFLQIDILTDVGMMLQYAALPTNYPDPDPDASQSHPKQFLLTY